MSRSISPRRVRAIFTKELTEYRRNRSIVSTMAIIPVIFVLAPLIQIFSSPASRSPAGTGCSTCWASRRSSRRWWPPIRWSASASGPSSPS
ncbi:MAG: hypothetical protein U0S48_00835 [Solirubrobacteraceae bacterium]